MHCSCTCNSVTMFYKFQTCTTFMCDVLQLLPKEELYAPPLNIHVMDKRSFGRCPLVGTHVVKTLKPFYVEPKPSEGNHLAVAVAQQVTKPTCTIEGESTLIIEDVKEALDVSALWRLLIEHNINGSNHMNPNSKYNNIIIMLVQCVSVCVCVCVLPAV